MERENCKMAQRGKNLVEPSRTSETKKKAGNERERERERGRGREENRDAFIATVAYINSPAVSPRSAVHYTIFNIQTPRLCF
jgi:hypothetical protein